MPSVLEVRFRLGGPRSVLAIMLVGLVIAALGGLALSWDGAYYLFSTLDTRYPFLPNGRVVNVLLQTPVLIAQALTDSMPVLRAVFGLSYVVVPVVALGASWIVIRHRRPSLFVWPVLAICLGTLPGQANFSSEAIQAAALMWPAILVALVGLDSNDLEACIALLATLTYATLAHPFSLVFLAPALLVVIVRRRVRLAALFGTALVAGIGISIITANPYESGRLTLQVIETAWSKSMMGAPYAALACAALAGLALLVRTPERARIAGWLAAGLVAVAGIALASWAVEPANWALSVEFRTLVPMAVLPFVGLACLDVLRPEPELSNARSIVTLVAALGFAGVLAIQGVGSAYLDAGMANALAASSSPCVATDAVPGLHTSLLDTWATPSRSLLLQGRAPTHVVLDPASCTELTTDHKLKIADWDERAATYGWIRFDHLIR